MEQITIFDLLAESKPLPSNIKLLSLFSGIGAFEKALDNLGISYELVGYCEIDKYASKSYSAIHGVSEDMNLWDVTKVDEKALPKDIDLVTYGFPCQDISLAGKQKGLFNEDGSKTRSGLFFDALRIIEETQPRVAIAENVKNLVGKKFNAQFQVVLASLEAAGYNNYYKVLNSKDFGVPQNRERVFIVSIRKDIDSGYTFPKGFPLEKRLKDVLEDTVDEKYYLDGKFDFITKINENYSVMNGGSIGKMHDISRRAYSEQATAPTIPTCAGGLKVAEPKVIGGIGEKKSNGGKQWYQQDRVYDDGVAISVTTGFHPYYATQEPAAYDEQNQYVRKDGTVGTITTDGSSPKHNNRVLVWDGYNQRIRAEQSCVGTITQNCGADLKRNGQGIIETQRKGNVWLSEKGVKFVLASKRGMCTDVNADVAQPLTAKGQQNWTGSFVSPDIESLEKSTTIGSTEPVKINLKNGETITSNDDTSYLRIRKLTPKECFRLMGFDDSDFHKAELVNSNTQLYKQAGNSIVVDVLEYLLKSLYENL